MFTGIISDIGEVVSTEPNAGGKRIVMRVPWKDLPAGASVACNGVCMTAAEVKDGTMMVQASSETLTCTTLGEWRSGFRVNLERPMKIGDELGGHLVYGHVDATVKVVERWDQNEETRLFFETTPMYSRFISSKGSVSIDGVSLTVNKVQGPYFWITVIPYTRDHTTLHQLDVGGRANMEVDRLARMLARLMTDRTL
ncbi:MAG: riboflavin synthase [Alphaproteobacteria bacterium]|nr:MAG: riboflavin synthase [Alphaproteobacteria bacterium]